MEYAPVKRTVVGALRTVTKWNGEGQAPLGLTRDRREIIRVTHTRHPAPPLTCLALPPLATRHRPRPGPRAPRAPPAGAAEPEWPPTSHSVTAATDPRTVSGCRPEPSYAPAAARA